MLSWMAPAALWIGLTVLPVILFYFLRMRFRDQPFSSIYIWLRLQKLTRSGSRLRWRSVLLLLLQIGAVLAVVAVIARPFWSSRQRTEPGTVFLIDVSASMAAKDEVSATGDRISRIERARLLLQQEINRMPSHSYGAVFLCSSGITQLGEASNNRKRLINGLRNLEPTGAGFKEAQIAAELQAWLQTERRPWQACLVTDGGLDLNGGKLTEIFRGAWRVLTVGKGDNNIGLTGLRLLPGSQAHFVVYNGRTQTAVIGVTLGWRAQARNEKLLINTRIKVAPGFTRQVLPFSGTAQSGIYRLAITAATNSSTWDDRYLLAVNPPRRFRVLLIGTPNPFLRAALRNPKIELTMLPQFPRSGSTGAAWDLVVADGVKLPAGMQSNSLSIGVLPEQAPVRLGPVVSGSLAATDTSHPLARFVDWGSARVAGGNSLICEPNVQSLAVVEGQPVMAVWEQGGYRSVVFGTDLFHSDLALSGAFPVFLQNLLQWCVPQAANPLAYNLTVGEPVLLAENPDWRLLDTRGIRAARNGRMLSLRAQAPGVFRWQSEQARGMVVANVAPSELQIAPKVLTAPKSKLRITAKYAISRRNLGEYFSFLFLVLLCLEWICWSGGWRMIKE